MAAMLRRPTDAENATFKDRVRYVLDVTGRTANWYEANSGGLLQRGEVHRWANHPTRGANVGGAKAKAAADVFGVDYEWLTTGSSQAGRVFANEQAYALPAALERAVDAKVARAIEEREAKSDREPSSSRRPYLMPVLKKVAKHARKRAR
jgi:hypothetical protein